MVLPSLLVFSFKGGCWMGTRGDLRGCMALSLRSLKTMARRTVRRFVQMQSGTNQIAEPSSDSAMRFQSSLSNGNPSPVSFLACALGEQRKLPSLPTLYLRSQAAIGPWVISCRSKGHILTSNQGFHQVVPCRKQHIVEPAWWLVRLPRKERRACYGYAEPGQTVHFRQ